MVDDVFSKNSDHRLVRLRMLFSMWAFSENPLFYLVHISA